MRCNDSQVDLEDLTAPLDLKVMQQEITARQVIPQVRDRSALRVIDRISNRNNRGHQLASSMARSRPCTASSSSAVAVDLSAKADRTSESIKNISCFGAFRTGISRR